MSKQVENSIVQTVIDYRTYSHRFKQKRQRRNNFNWDMYNQKQDYSRKRPGQSREFIPKLAMGVEHLVSTILAALTNRSDDWFNVDKGMQSDDVFDLDTVRRILAYHLHNADIYPTIANAIKNVGLDSGVCAKIVGNVYQQRRFIYERGDLIYKPDGTVIRRKPKVNEKKMFRWELGVDLIDWEDYYFDPEPNPSGKLFEIHNVKRDLHELIQVAEDYDIYDKKLLAQVSEEFQIRETEENKRRRKDVTDGGTDLAFRKKVTVTEMWGTILDRGTGKVKEKNIVCTILNDKYLIRPPEPIPDLDGQTPFVYASLLEIPKSTIGKGMFDSASALNKTQNEMYNLLADGMFDAIKGIKQFRKGLLTNPSQASGGIYSGITLEIDESTPAGVQAVEKVRTGEVPPDAYNFYRYTEEVVNESMLSNELKLGGLPASSTKATIANISDQTVQGLFAGIARLFEDRFVAPLLYKSWLKILQEMDSDEFAEETLVALIGSDKAVKLSQMSIEERYARGAMVAKFRVRGISGILQRVREFNKLTQVLGLISQNPDLYAAYKKDYSIDRTLGAILSSAGVREDELRLSEEERRQQKLQGGVQQMMQQALAAAESGAGEGAQGEPVSAQEGEATQLPPTEGTI